MAIDYAVLHTELTTDPRGYGYAPYVASGDVDTLATMLNLVRTGTNGGPAITVRRKDILAREVIETIDNRDFTTNVTAAELACYQSVTTQAEPIRLEFDDGTETRTLGNLRRMLQNPGPQGSRDRLNLLARQQGSRAEELFSQGTLVSYQDVSLALQES